MFGFEMSDNQFYGVASFHPFSNRRSFLSLAVGEECGQVGATVPAVALVAGDLLGHPSDEAFCLFESFAEGASVAGTGLGLRRSSCPSPW